jgi:putative phosphoesterase
MKRIGLLSDTHSYIDDNILNHFKDCDEIWHGGDIGDIAVADKIAAFKPFRAVYGNIDNKEVRVSYPLNLRFTIEELDVFITHIGGYPNRYNKRVREILTENPPDLYICGHSHILKVMPDKKLGLIHMNPGACGHIGFHHMRTLIRFSVSGKKISDVEVIELGRRGVGAAKK